jgi:outer membrane protein assembly factor BamB
MLFYGSSADCKIYALDAATGRLRWSLFTDGPVRFAPAVWHDRVFVISDDGHLYCLAASDGSLLWR